MKDLKLSLIIQALDRATAPLRQVAAGLDHVREHTEKLHHAMHKLGLAEFVGTAFFTGAALEFGHSIFELTDHVAEMGEAALRSSEKTSVGVETMQRWTWAAKQLGVESDSLNRAFAMMNLHVGEAVKGNKLSADALKLVGVNMKEVRALSGDPGALFARIIDGFQSIKSPAAQAVAAQGIFSRSWTEMAPLLKAPRGEIAELMDQLRKAHVVMTTEDAEAAKKFELTKGDMGLEVSGLSVRIGRELMPKLGQVMEKMTNWIESISDDSINKFAQAVGKLADDFVNLMPLFQKLALKATDLADKLLKLSDNTTFLKGAFVALAGVLAGQALIGIASMALSIGNVAVAAVRAGTMIFGLLLPSIGSLSEAMLALNLVMDANPIGLIALGITALIAAIAGIGFAIYEIVDHWTDFVDWWADLWENVKDPLMTILPLFGLFADGAAYIKDHWNSIGGWFVKQLDGIEKAFSQTWKRITDLIPPWLKTLLKIGAMGLTLAAAPAVAPTVAATLMPRIQAAGNADRGERHSTLYLHDHLARMLDHGLKPSPPVPIPSVSAPTATSDNIHFTASNPGYYQTDSQQAQRKSASFGEKSRSKSDILGTIIVKAEPGTSVTRMQASNGVEFRSNRGKLPD